MHKAKLITYLQSFIETGRKPNSTELVYILADYLSQNVPINVHCRDIAEAIQTKYGFWNEASNPNRSANDAVSKALVYGKITPERYKKDNERRKDLEYLLGANIVVSPDNNRTISLIKSESNSSNSLSI